MLFPRLNGARNRTVAEKHLGDLASLNFVLLEVFSSS